MKRKDVYAKIHGYNNAFTDALCSGESILFSGIQDHKRYFSGIFLIMTILIAAEIVLFCFCRAEKIPYLTMVLPFVVLFPVMKKKSAVGNVKNGYAVTENRVLIYTDGDLLQARLEDITDVCIYSVKGKLGTLEIYKKDPSEAGKTMSGGIIRDIYLPEEIRSEILLQKNNISADR